MSFPSPDLRAIKSFEALIPYLENELDWPLQQYGFDDLTFEYTPAELGLKDEDAVKIKAIHQLRPLRHGQPWGIFFVEFERKKLPVVLLRRVLSHLVVKKRASANRADAAAWRMGDLLFISAFGDRVTGQEIAFAHFHQDGGELPTLRVLGWDGGDTPLKLEYVAATLRGKLSWPDDPDDADAWRDSWRQAFRHRLGHTIRTADALAVALAALARRIRGAALLLLAHETEQGALRSLHKAFQTALIHDLSEADFADTYAQTITYGLLTAAISRTEMSEGAYGTALIAENVADIVPVTNPFLKEMLQTFLQVGGRKGGIDFDELGIQDVVELLRGGETDLPAVLRDFGNKTQGEDPVIHFYEHFLAAYDKKLKVQRGVFYTPKPVVGYIVRSVHELLQTEFGLADGLADTTTWREMAQRNPDLTIPEGTDPDSPFVVILDPATGTATFLVEVVAVIYRTLTARWQKAGLNAAQRQTAWNEYVPKHLLPRLYGYELMMAPYAIAHMKVSLKLNETKFSDWNLLGPTDRLRIYLTNALERPDEQQKLTGILPALAHEAEAVNKVKRQTRFTVVMGNPPYSGHSANKMPDDWIGLRNAYYYVDGKPLGERNPKWLQDDYVKFMRFGQQRLEHTGTGILAMITNHGYLDNPTFRGMRESLLQTFDDIYVLDLHGNAKKKETAPDGSKDENVFDIIQGVAVGVFVKYGETQKDAFALFHQYDNYGLREAKYVFLTLKTGFDDYSEIKPRLPHYLFVQHDLSLHSEYSKGWSLPELFTLNNMGITSGNDKEFVVFEDKELAASLDTDKNIDVFYRPFDLRRLHYEPNLLARAREDFNFHLHDRENKAISTLRRPRNDLVGNFYVTNHPTDKCIISSLDNAQIFPLYKYEGQGKGLFDVLDHPMSDKGRRPNLNPRFIADLEMVFSLQFVTEGWGNLVTTLGPEDVFYYAYAIFHSSVYRQRYAEFLKIDFPRLPLTSSLELFRALARLGSELVALHLVEFVLEDEVGAPAEWPRYPRLAQFSGSNRVIEKFPAANKAWQAGTVAINSSSSFSGVPEEVWNFHIGGYQVCHKWLKDRKDRALSDADILHYAKIITALHQTIRLMAEIDAAIEAHGGWPIQ